MNHGALKIHPAGLAPHLAGIKDFEVRVNDRDYQMGDRFYFTEWSDGKPTGWNGGWRVITEVMQNGDGPGSDGIMTGWCVFQHRPCPIGMQV